jgi:uncharacterized protein (DUF302 family)
MKISVIHKDESIYVEFSPEKFTGLLEEYYDKFGNIKEAMEQIVTDLKKELITM